MACLQGIIKYSANISVLLLMEYLTHMRMQNEKKGTSLENEAEQCGDAPL